MGLIERVTGFYRSLSDKPKPQPKEQTPTTKPIQAKPTTYYIKSKPKPKPKTSEPKLETSVPSPTVTKLALQGGVQVTQKNIEHYKKKVEELNKKATELEAEKKQLEGKYKQLKKIEEKFGYVGKTDAVEFNIAAQEFNKKVEKYNKEVSTTKQYKKVVEDYEKIKLHKEQQKQKEKLENLIKEAPETHPSVTKGRGLSSPPEETTTVKTISQEELNNMIKDLPQAAKEKVKQAAEEGATIKVYSGEAPGVNPLTVSPVKDVIQAEKKKLEEKSSVFSAGEKIKEIGAKAGEKVTETLPLERLPGGSFVEGLVAGIAEAPFRGIGSAIQGFAWHEAKLKGEELSPYQERIIGESVREAYKLQMESFAMEGVAKILRVGAEAGVRAGGKMVDVASPYVEKGIVTARLTYLTAEKKLSDLAWRVSEPLYQRGILRAQTEEVSRSIKNPFRTWRMIQEGISSKGQGMTVERAQGKFTREELKRIFETADKIKKGVSSKGQGMTVERAQGKFTREELGKIFSDTRRSGLRRLIREHLAEERRRFWELSEIKSISETGETASIKAVRKGKRMIITHEKIPTEKIPEWKWLEYEKQGSDFENLRSEPPKMRKRPSKSFDFDRDLTKKLREEWRQRELRYESEVKKGRGEEKRSGSGLKTIQLQKEVKEITKTETKGYDSYQVLKRKRFVGADVDYGDYPPPQHLIAERGGREGPRAVLKVGMGILGRGFHELHKSITNQMINQFTGLRPDLEIKQGIDQGIRSFNLVGPVTGPGTGTTPITGTSPFIDIPPFERVSPRVRQKPKTITGEPSLPGLTPKQTPGEVTTPKPDTITDLVSELISSRRRGMFQFKLILDKSGRRLNIFDFVGVRHRKMKNVYGDIFAPIKLNLKIGI